MACRLLCVASLLVVGIIGTSRFQSRGSDWRSATNIGSCTFDGGSLCNWTNEHGHGWYWTVRNSAARMEKNWSGKDNLAVLTSPTLCQSSRSAVCLGVAMHFRLTAPQLMTLDIELCSNAVCRTLWSSWRTVRTKKPQDVSVSFGAQGIFTIRVKGKIESTVRSGFIYLEDLTYSNPSCDQTTSTHGNFNVTSPQAAINVRTDAASVPVNTTPSVITCITAESVVGSSSPDNTMSLGIAAGGIAIAMVIAAAAVVVRYYVKNGRWREPLLKRKKPAKGQVTQRSPAAASNELYNALGINRQGNCQTLEIVLTQQMATNEMEASAYAEIDYIDATFPRRSQRSLPHSAEKEHAQNVTSLTLTPVQTMKTVYYTMDGGKYSEENPAYIKMSKKTTYQNVDSGL